MATLLNRYASSDGTVYQSAGRTGLGELLDFIVAFPTHNVFRKNVVMLDEFNKENWTECESFKLERTTKPEDFSIPDNRLGKFLVKFNPSSASIEQVMYATEAGLVWILHNMATKSTMYPVKELDPGHYFWPVNQR
jgi:hypothetical protein